jgi:CRP-like cAMP-binding protein
MTSFGEVLAVSLVGLGTTSSALLGAAIGLYVPISKRVLACILAFAAGSLISALAIELAFQGARDLHRQGFDALSAWSFVAGGFALGAIIYYSTTLFLEQKGAAVRYSTRFREYALDRKQQETKKLIQLLSECDLMRHLPPQEIEAILPSVQTQTLAPGEILFHAGDPADALYIVERGKVDVMAASAPNADTAESPIAQLGPGHAFGEMALLSGGARTATIRAAEDTQLLKISKEDFERLLATDRQLAKAVRRLSHSRAINNLSAGGPHASTWANVASSSLDHLTREEANKMLTQAGHGAGLAIVFGNILDTIPGCLVIGSKFNGLGSLSLTLMLGMFLGGIPEAAASATMLTRAGFQPKTIFGLWSIVLAAGVIAAAAGKIFIGSADSLTAIFSEALAGGAVLALVAHAMIPEAIHDGGSLIVLPTVGGFLFALYLALAETFV